MYRVLCAYRSTFWDNRQRWKFCKVFLHSYSKISSLSTVGSLQRGFWKIPEQPKITMKSQSNLHDLQQSSKPTSTYVHEGWCCRWEFFTTNPAHTHKYMKWYRGIHSHHNPAAHAQPQVPNKSTTLIDKKRHCISFGSTKWHSKNSKTNSCQFKHSMKEAHFLW
jgi:hypothetical protein